MENKSILVTFGNESTPEPLQKCAYVPSNLHFIDYLSNVYIVTCTVNALSSPLAVFGNAVVFYSILQTRNLHDDPSHLLLAILALTDLTVGLIQQPLYVIYKAAEINRLAQISCIAGLLTNMLAGLLPGMSFFIVTIITLDRFLALHLHMRYKSIMTRSLVVKIILACLVFFIGAVSLYPWKPRIPLFIGITTIPSCLVISTISYIKIYRIVRKHQIAISSQNTCQPAASQSTNQDGINMKKFWKFVVNFSYVYIIMIICFLPYAVTLLTRGLIGITKEYKVALNVTSTVIFMNSSLNPLVYCWRITEVRRAVFKTLRAITGMQFASSTENSSTYNQSNERAA